jgi:hypothetical protein
MAKLQRQLEANKQDNHEDDDDKINRDNSASGVKTRRPLVHVQGK